jgi:type VI secretion system secreted protein VgrG
MPDDNAEPLYKYIIHALGQSDQLDLLEFSGTELVNEFGLFRLRAFANSAINVEDYIGKPMRLETKLEGGTVRNFLLTVFGVRRLLHESKGKLYEFELRPCFHFLSKRTNSRIFKKMSAIQAINLIISSYGDTVGPINDQSQTTFPELEFLVQYHETDLDFIRRLLERYGVNFHVKMEATTQRLVLTSAADDFAAAEVGIVSFSTDTATAARETWNLDSWTVHRQVTTGKVKLTDYDFTAPDKDMEVNKANALRYTGANLEYYDYPGGYDKEGDIGNFAQRQLDAFRSAENIVRTDGNLYQLGAGTTVSVKNHDGAGGTADYAVLAATHHLAAANLRSGQKSAADARYSGSYVLTAKSNKISPPMVTPRPVMRGPQTGVITDGADGTTDEYGRVRVKLFWAGGNDTIPIRVSQMWASKNWGSVFIPHAGMEVIVDFLDGDPDRPIVVGCVYNANNMPPWDLPGKKTVSGIKTVTNNELSFDDDRGKEKIFIHARRDMETEVENDSTVTIDQNRKMTVKGTEVKDVTGSLTLKSQDSIVLEVGANKITIDQNGITINGLQVAIKATSTLTTEGLASADHKGGGAMTISAGIVSIN